MTTRAKPNRRRVYDARDMAKRMREAFVDRPVEYQETLNFSWPTVMQNVGDSLSVAYASDKWHNKNSSGDRETELYKHLAESRNRALARPGVLHDYYARNNAWPVIGPMVSLSECPMPKHFAVLGLFEEINLRLHTGGSDDSPRFGRSKDAGIVHVDLPHAYLGGGRILWSRVNSGRSDEPFIFAYTKSDGVMFVVIGDELDIEKDGIVG